MNKYLWHMLGWVLYTPFMLYAVEFLGDLSLEERRSTLSEMWLVVAVALVLGVALLWSTAKTLLGDIGDNGDNNEQE